MIKIGFIGYGKMAEYMTNGIDINNGYEITIYDKSGDRCNLAKEKGYGVANDISEIYKSDVIFLAIKPQNLSEIENTTLNQNTTVISMLAGVSISTIEEKFKNANVIRIMPNLPISQKKGVIAVHSKCDVNPVIFKILNSLGMTIEIPENKFDEFTAISGSAPAYVFEFMKIYQDACAQYGFEKSKEIVISNMKGAIAMYENSGTSLDQLIESVCSKGGTTIEAISHFRKKKMDKIFNEGIEKCKKRSKELSKK